jgi:hypothetical protein
VAEGVGDPLVAILALLLLQEGTGTVKGVVELGHRAPPRRTIHVDADPSAGVVYPNGLPSEELVVGDRGGIKWAFVAIIRGFEGKKIPAPANTLNLDFQRFQITPRVLGIMQGQELSMRSYDSTLHNMHLLPLKNKESNVGLPDAQTPPYHRSFSTPEREIKAKCDVHTWEIAWIHVLPHPFHAVTGDDGRFEIKGLPPGRYTLEACQETCKTKMLEIEVNAGETAVANFILETIDPPPPFPWLAVSVVAGALIALGIVLAFLLLRRGA